MAEEKKKKIKHVVEEVTAEPEKEKAQELMPTPIDPTPVTPTPVEPVSPTSEEESLPKETAVEPKPEALEDEPTSEKKSNAKVIIITALVTALITAALAGGIYVYFNGIDSLKKEVTATPSPAATLMPEESPTPSASPSATPKVATYKIQILNGSGKAGEANKARALIEKEGFKVSSTGNAASFDFEETLIQAKKSVPADVIEMIETALSKSYATKIGEVLPTSSSYDIIITVGTK